MGYWWPILNIISRKKYLKKSTTGGKITKICICHQNLKIFTMKPISNGQCQQFDLARKIFLSDYFLFLVFKVEEVLLEQHFLVPLQFLVFQYQEGRPRFQQFVVETHQRMIPLFHHPCKTQRLASLLPFLSWQVSWIPLHQPFRVLNHNLILQHNLVAVILRTDLNFPWEFWCPLERKFLQFHFREMDRSRCMVCIHMPWIRLRRPHP